LIQSGLALCMHNVVADMSRVHRKPHSIEFGSKRLAYCGLCNTIQHRNCLPGKCSRPHCNGHLYRLRADNKRVVDIVVKKPQIVVKTRQSYYQDSKRDNSTGESLVSVTSRDSDLAVQAAAVSRTNRISQADNIGTDRLSLR
jgi:hypothetical protein